MNAKSGPHELPDQTTSDDPAVGWLASSIRERIETLPPEKRELFLQRLRAELRQPHDFNPVGRGSGPRIAPLSFGQQRLWFLEQLGDLGAAYHLSLRMRFRGELDREALRLSLDRIVARHETLRTTFDSVDGSPVQRIAAVEESRFALREHDLTDDPRGDALRRLQGKERAEPFDLTHGPLVRGRLVRVGDEDHLLLVTMHHIVSDGWSLGLFRNELSALYEATLRGEAESLPPLPVQYSDYAVWQRRWMRGEVLRRQAEYWKQTLSGAPVLLELPTARPRPIQQSYAGASVRLELPEALTTGLKALSRRHGATLFMTLLSGLAAVLSRLSGQPEVVIGTPTANRGRREIEGLIGFFVNTLALRIDLSGSPTVAELLRQVKERALGAQAHQDIPFERVVDLIQPARSLSHTPLFQVMFAWQNTQGSVPQFSRPRVRRAEHPGRSTGAGPTAPVAEGAAMFDLTVSLSEVGGRIRGRLEYATALFDRETVERYAGYVRRVLEAMVADDQQVVGQIPLLSEAEWRQVLEEGRATKTPYPSDWCVHDLFEQQVERTPDTVAIVHEGEGLSYAELNRRANRLAHHLRELGVGPEVRVALCMDRSLEMVVGLLGVLKAGGAYVPMDPTYPEERLRYMLQDSRPAVVLTQRRSVERLAGAALPMVALDEDATALAQRPETNPASGALGPRHLAYVIYTSGSTGRPKGVMVTHEGVVNLLHAMGRLVALVPTDRLLALTTIGFDIAALELFLPLARGACAVVVGRAIGTDPAQLMLAVDGLAATVMQATPSTWRMLVDAGWGGSGELRALSGGEALPAALGAALRTRVGGLWNVYGPTETTIWSSVEEVSRERGTHLAGRDPTAIGRPIANTRMYLLDPEGQPVPVGVAGELHVGGVGVARGYLDRPGLTSERFVADPFGPPGSRLYRTGDLARRRPDGTIDFLGRNDHQIKVRGYRIELGEIEARLCEHPAAREAVVVARRDTADDVRLVAYYMGPEGTDTTGAAALLRHLTERLPEYMVPSAYVRIEAWPLTPNGKVDRRALPLPQDDAYARRGHQAPVGEVEEALARIWAEVLGLRSVGRDDHFFELGGHSLLLVQVHDQLQNRLGASCTLMDLFRFPTVRVLAAHLSDSQDRPVQLRFNQMEERAAAQRLARERRRDRGSRAERSENPSQGG